MKPLTAALAAFAAAVAVSAQGRSQWVYVGADHRLHYGTDARGNRIMDFSHAGYGGGGVALPAVRVARTLSAQPGDNTARIQAAIDEVSRLPPAADGFRGAVLLERGTYDVAGQLTIAASGVVLRGSGSRDGETHIRVTGAPHRFLDVAGAGAWQPDGASAAITDAYVPSGADHVTVDAPSRFKAGDAVLVRRPVTDAWIRFMEMHTLSRDGKPQTWIKAGSLIDADRVIKSISGNRVTFEVPVSDSYDAAYLNPPGATIVKYTFPGRIEQVGVESLRVTAPVQDVPITQGQVLAPAHECSQRRMGTRCGGRGHAEHDHPRAIGPESDARGRAHPSQRCPSPRRLRLPTSPSPARRFSCIARASAARASGPS